MKLTLRTDNLQKKLSFINHAISSKNDLPILLNILLSAKNGILTLSSTDLEIGIYTTLPVEVEEEGSITVPAKTFSELINSLSQETLTIETKEKSLMVNSKKTKSSFQTIPAEDFPKLFEEKGEILAKLSAKDLHTDFSCVIFASSLEAARPALSGILIRQEGKGFLLVATDGYRLSLKKTEMLGVQEVVTQEEKSVIIPARVFREVLSLKEADEVTIYIAKNSNQVIFELGETIIIGRLIEAEFPSFAKIIPSDFSLQINFDREELLKAVKICSIFARDSANIIKLSCKQEKIVVSSQATTAGENTVEVEAHLQGEENEIAFNARYLLDVLSNIEQNELVFEMTGPLNPGVFKVKDDASFLHLIMPIKVQN